MQKKAQHCRIRIDEEDDGDTGRIWKTEDSTF
jgi:hypothetical protein